MTQLKDLTDEQKESLKVKHYTLHIPATATPEQLSFIQSMSASIINNEPYTIIHEDALQFLLRLAINYRNTLAEFDEFERWKPTDNLFLEKIIQDFQPMLDYIQEQFKIDINKYKRNL